MLCKTHTAHDRWCCHWKTLGSQMEDSGMRQAWTPAVNVCVRWCSAETEQFAIHRVTKCPPHASAPVICHRCHSHSSCLVSSLSGSAICVGTVSNPLMFSLSTQIVPSLFPLSVPLSFSSAGLLGYFPFQPVFVFPPISSPFSSLCCFSLAPLSLFVQWLLRSSVPCCSYQFERMFDSCRIPGTLTGSIKYISPHKSYPHLRTKYNKLTLPPVKHWPSE